MDATTKAILSVTHAPGIYFGMPEQEYFDDPALGSGDMRALALVGIMLLKIWATNNNGTQPIETFAAALVETYAQVDDNYDAAPQRLRQVSIRRWQTVPMAAL